MPQMMPMLWINIFIMLILINFSMLFIIYFMNFYLTNITFKKINHNWNWKW